MPIIDNLFANYYVSPGVDQQNVYYFFSTAAQTIAAFIAFILAGYALVYQAMDNIESRDDTKAEVHHRLKLEYYKQIKIISWITGFTLFFSLLVIWSNGASFVLKKELIGLTFVLILITLYKAIRFVIKMIEPNKLKKAAIELLKEEFKQPTEPVDESKFVSTFINIEKVIKNIIYQHDVVVRGKYQREFFTIRDGIEALFRNEFINRELYDRLIELNKYRNLVVHGHINEVDKSMVVQAHQILEKLKQIGDKPEGSES